MCDICPVPNNNSQEKELKALNSAPKGSGASDDGSAKFGSKIKEVLLRRIYILSWIKTYTREMAIADFIAGITLGLTMIPQSIAYASLANLPEEYGLYAAFLGSFVYVLFGTVKEVSIGPTSLMALLTLQYTYNKPVEFVFILAFLCGIVELAMGVLQLGFIVNLISIPVTNSFTTATSLIIIGTQLKTLLGLSYKTKLFSESVIKLVQQITQTRMGDAVLGVSCIILLLAMRYIKDLKISEKLPFSKLLSNILWYVSISRNAIIVLITSIIAYNWTTSVDNTIPFRLSGKVEPGIPSFQLPAFSIEYNNQTLNFFGICNELGSSIIVLPLVAVLANVAIAKSFAVGSVVDASQEMIALGICNILGGCFQAFPTCGAFTRSAVSNASGIRTPMAGVYSGIMTLLALSLLTPYFYYIPKATLAAVLISAVVFMIDFSIVSKLWKESKRDLIPWTGCLLSGLMYGVEIGLLLGVTLSVVILIYMLTKPQTLVETREIETMSYILVTPKIGLFYSGIDTLREIVTELCVKTRCQLPIVLNFTKISALDFTSVKGLGSLAADLKKNNATLIFQNMDFELENKLSHIEHVLFRRNGETLYEYLRQHTSTLTSVDTKM